MLSIQATGSKQCTPNLLPARINHNGPINNTHQHWAPNTDENGTRHVHFRGRHLYGTPLALPSHYTGAVLLITDKPAAPAPSHPLSTGPGLTHDNGDEDSDEMVDERVEEVMVAEQIGEFDEVLVWGHGGTVDEGSDLFVRGVREWVGFAEAMHCDEDAVEEKNKKAP